jgi:Nuclease-related domain
VVRWASHRSSAVDDLPVPPTLAPKSAGRPALSRAAGPPVVPQAALDARQAVGRDGELRVRALLLEKLPAGTLVLNNLELPGLGGDVDLLVVGDTGVFLPEVKTGQEPSRAVRMAAAGVGLRPAASGKRCPIPRSRPSARFEPCAPISRGRTPSCVAARSCGSTGSSCLPIHAQPWTPTRARCRPWRLKAPWRG